jgi:hypothetical protein
VLIGVAVAEKVQRGLPARLDECDRGEEPEREGLRIPGLEGTGGVARKLEAEASRGALQRAIASCNGNPLVDERTGARHADVRLGGLWKPCQTWFVEG